MGLSLQETNSLTFALLWGSRGLLWGTPTDTKNEVDPVQERGLGIREQPLPGAPASVSPEVQCTLVHGWPRKASGLLDPVLSL